MNENIIRGIYMFNNLRSLFENLNFQLTYTLIKGEALSLQAYKKNGGRHYGDIDILISKKDVNLVTKVLNDNGFFQDKYLCGELSKFELKYAKLSHQTFPFRKKMNNFQIEIDLNTDLFWGEYNGERIDIPLFLSDCLTENIYGCTVKTLSIEKAFVQLMLHHFKDFNSFDHIVYHNPLTDQVFADVYNIINNNLEILTIENVYNLSVKYKIVPYVYYVLFYANEVYKDNLITPYLGKLKTSAGIALLNKYGLHDAEKKEWVVDFATRKNANNLYKYIAQDLTEKDIKKIELHKKIFG